MAILTKKEIEHCILKKEIEFEPMIDAFQLQPHAVDLRLGFTFYIPKSWELNPKGREAINIDYLDIINGKNSFDLVELKPGQYFETLPNEFIIASTLEKIMINNLKLMAVLYPRSTFNRRGLSVDLSGIIDSGYKGHLMIPIQNNTTNQIVKIYPGERVCQIVIEELASELSPQDIEFHGVNKAKYLDADAHNLISKSDKEEEIHYIRRGEIQKIKDNYPIIK